MNMQTLISHSFHGLVFIFIGIVSLFSACAVPEKPAAPSVRFRFAVVGNTLPDSPFGGEPEYLIRALREINGHNPDFVIHLGNIIHGGKAAFGIREADIMRQHAKLSPLFKELKANLYTVLGSKDLYNDSHDIYSRLFSKQPNYTFNYGAARFIVFNTLNEYPENGVPFKWLERELAAAAGRYRIFLITYNSIYHDTNRPGLYTLSAQVHELLVKYQVEAVLSGNPVDYKTVARDGITYYILGCGGYSRTTYNWKSTHYYIVDVDNRKIDIVPVKMKLPVYGNPWGNQ